MPPTEISLRDESLIVPFEIKELSGDGEFVGIASPYGNVDLGKDVAEPGMFTKSISDRGNKVRLKDSHDLRLGIAEITDTPTGLIAKGKINLEKQSGRDAYSDLKFYQENGQPLGLSIGFQTVKADYDEKGIRHLKEVKLFEVSITEIPMNENALVMAVKDARRLFARTKSLVGTVRRGLERKRLAPVLEGKQVTDDSEGPDDFNEELAEIQLADASFQMFNALRNALQGCFYSGVAKEQIVGSSETIIQQFHDAYTAFLPDYLALMEEYYGSLEQWSQHALELKAAGKTKRVDGEDLPASAFAFVGDPEKTVTWVYPIKFSTDEKTKSHLRNALSRFGQSNVPGANAPAVLAKIRAAAKRHGIDASEKSAAIDLEIKLGAKFSADTRSAMSAACEKVKSGMDMAMEGHNDLLALVSNEAGDPTSDEKAAKTEKPEPETHSAAQIQSALDALRSLIPGANGKSQLGESEHGN